MRIVRLFFLHHYCLQVLGVDLGWWSSQRLGAQGEIEVDPRTSGCSYGGRKNTQCSTVVPNLFRLTMTATKPEV